MIHSSIIEEPAPDRTEWDEWAAQGASLPSQADQEHYRKRAREEAEAARAATCREARLAHEELAAAYRKLGSFSESGTEPNRPAAFSFSPRPTD